MADAPEVPLYDHLVHVHHELDVQLQRLLHTPHLSPQEQLEEAALKKRKLAVKDQLAAIGARRAS
jgi:uncharacterized protein YdcH (DUF465 family)